MNIIGRKNWYFILSAIVIVPGIVSLLFYGLLPSIDFTGGSKLEIKFLDSLPVTKENVQKTIETDKVKIISIKKQEGNTFLIRSEPIDQITKSKVLDSLRNKYPSMQEINFETLGSVIGNEARNNAIKAFLIASFVITLYISFAFAAVSKPVSSWKFGVCAIVALLHDILVVIGIFSILGHFFGIEVDSLFITALLTVMGFSVHDTIVVFDRIRENLKKDFSSSFQNIVNNSILETLNRSINTSLTVIIVLSTLLLFSGDSIRWFLMALLIGILSGTYSSIFNAAPFLVVWYDYDRRKEQLRR